MAAKWNEAVNTATCGAGIDIGDSHCGCIRSTRLPQLISSAVVGCSKIDFPVESRKAAGKRALGGSRRVDVLDPNGAILRSVALPKLSSTAIVGRKINESVHRTKTLRVRRDRSRCRGSDILEQCGTRGRAVADPQFAITRIRRNAAKIKTVSNTV